MRVGEHDTAGNMLRLPGPNGSIYRDTDGGYLLKTTDHSVPYLFVEDVLAAYNELNGSSYKTLPKIVKKLTSPIEFPSSRNPDNKYHVEQLPESMSLVCDCPGYGFRRHCSHIEAVEAVLSEKEQSNEDT